MTTITSASLQPPYSLQTPLENLLALESAYIDAFVAAFPTLNSLTFQNPDLLKTINTAFLPNFKAIISDSRKTSGLNAFWTQLFHHYQSIYATASSFEHYIVTHKSSSFYSSTISPQSAPTYPPVASAIFSYAVNSFYKLLATQLSGAFPATPDHSFITSLINAVYVAVPFGIDFPLPGSSVSRSALRTIFPFSAVALSHTKDPWSCLAQNPLSTPLTSPSMSQLQSTTRPIEQPPCTLHQIDAIVSLCTYFKTVVLSNLPNLLTLCLNLHLPSTTPIADQLGLTEFDPFFAPLSQSTSIFSIFMKLINIEGYIDVRHFLYNIFATDETILLKCELHSMQLFNATSPFLQSRPFYQFIHALSPMQLSSFINKNQFLHHFTNFFLSSSTPDRSELFPSEDGNVNNDELSGTQLASLSSSLRFFVTDVFFRVIQRLIPSPFADSKTTEVADGIPSISLASTAVLDLEQLTIDLLVNYPIVELLSRLPRQISLQLTLNIFSIPLPTSSSTATSIHLMLLRQISQNNILSYLLPFSLLNLGLNTHIIQRFMELILISVNYHCCMIVPNHQQDGSKYTVSEDADGVKRQKCAPKPSIDELLFPSLFSPHSTIAYPLEPTSQLFTHCGIDFVQQNSQSQFLTKAATSPLSLDEIGLCVQQLLGKPAANQQTVLNLFHTVFDYHSSAGKYQSTFFHFLQQHWPYVNSLVTSYTRHKAYFDASRDDIGSDCCAEGTTKSTNFNLNFNLDGFTPTIDIIDFYAFESSLFARDNPTEYDFGEIDITSVPFPETPSTQSTPNIDMDMIKIMFCSTVAQYLPAPFHNKPELVKTLLQHSTIFQSFNSTPIHSAEPIHRDIVSVAQTSPSNQLRASNNEQTQLPPHNPNDHNITIPFTFHIYIPSSTSTSQTITTSTTTPVQSYVPLTEKLTMNSFVSNATSDQHRNTSTHQHQTQKLMIEATFDKYCLLLAQLYHLYVKLQL